MTRCFLPVIVLCCYIKGQNFLPIIVLPDILCATFLWFKLEKMIDSTSALSLKKCKALIATSSWPSSPISSVIDFCRNCDRTISKSQNQKCKMRSVAGKHVEMFTRYSLNEVLQSLPHSDCELSSKVCKIYIWIHLVLYTIGRRFTFFVGTVLNKLL